MEEPFGIMFERARRKADIADFFKGRPLKVFSEKYVLDLSFCGLVYVDSPLVKELEQEGTCIGGRNAGMYASPGHSVPYGIAAQWSGHDSEVLYVYPD